MICRGDQILNLKLNLLVGIFQMECISIAKAKQRKWKSIRNNNPFY